MSAECSWPYSQRCYWEHVNAPPECRMRGAFAIHKIANSVSGYTQREDVRRPVECEICRCSFYEVIENRQAYFALQTQTVLSRLQAIPKWCNWAKQLNELSKVSTVKTKIGCLPWIGALNVVVRYRLSRWIALNQVQLFCYWTQRPTKMKIAQKLFLHCISRAKF